MNYANDRELLHFVRGVLAGWMQSTEHKDTVAINREHLMSLGQAIYDYTELSTYEVNFPTPTKGDSKVGGE